MILFLVQRYNNLRSHKSFIFESIYSIMRIPHLSNFAINYTAQKEKRIENNPNALKFKLEITMLENEL